MYTRDPAHPCNARIASSTVRLPHVIKYRSNFMQQIIAVISFCYIYVESSFKCRCQRMDLTLSLPMPTKLGGIVGKIINYGRLCDYAQKQGNCKRLLQSVNCYCLACAGIWSLVHVLPSTPISLSLYIGEQFSVVQCKLQ